VVSAPHYLAAQAGIRLLQAGGNAIDAAIAANATLNVVYPFVCGTGGDIFMMIYDAKSDDLYGLNGSGRAPAAATIDWFRANGHTRMPQRGILSVSVPGVVDGWVMAAERFGRLGLAKALQPAIEYAEEGFGVGPNLHNSITTVLKAPWCHPSWRAVYAPDGVAPAVNSILRVPELGRTLRLIAEQGRDVFYKGELAKALVEFSEREGGLFTLEDLAEHHGEWVEPLSIRYHDHRIFEMPPNTQGVTALQMLKMVEGFDLGDSPERAESVHLLIEAKKLAFADRAAYLTDLEQMKVPPERLISEDYLTERRKLIDPTKAAPDCVAGMSNSKGDTIYLCAADGEGNAVSLIQSNYMGVGSGLVVPGTGIELQNRAAYFSLDPDHVNHIAPRKRTLHTLIPSMAFKEGHDRPTVVFGTMGGDGQAQTHLQVYTKLISFGMNIQETLEAPRWVHGKTIENPDASEVLQIETRFPAETLTRLRELGHEVQGAGDWNRLMGYAQGITINPENGLLMGGADPRADSAAIGW
jgi:gamma-glutamyltranspeptidase/glutathione hydrolase